jgi:hypothetical protein
MLLADDSLDFFAFALCMAIITLLGQKTAVKNTLIMFTFLIKLRTYT